MRLIDVDYYCEHICKCNRKNCNVERCPLQAAPTAFDVDKVVEEMQKQITELQARYEALRTEKSEVMAKLEEMVGEYENDGEYGYFVGRWTGIMEAIKVIENGGKRE